MKRRLVEIQSCIKVEIPSLPNFVKRSDGTMMDVKDLDVESIHELAEEWTDALLEHAKQRRKLKP